MDSIFFYCSRYKNKTLVDLIETYECPVYHAEYDKADLENVSEGDILTIQEKKSIVKTLKEFDFS